MHGPESQLWPFVFPDLPPKIQPCDQSSGNYLDRRRSSNNSISGGVAVVDSRLVAAFAAGMKPAGRKRKKKGASAATTLSQAGAAADAGGPPEGEREEQSVSGARETEEQERTLNLLIEAFSSYSLQQVKSAYQEADGDPFRTAEILGASSAESTMCRSSTGQPSTGNKGGGKRKQKKVVASTGLVANVISKEYGGSVSAERGKRSECSRPKRHWNMYYSQEEAEEFLCSMLGGSCDLDPAVVKDVFG